MYVLFCLSLLATCAVDRTPVDFDTEVMPLFTRYGCNSGACHGSAAGRGGFKLSLYGSRPASDYDAIALELGHRRVNRAVPEHSLLLLKPTGQFDHGGDVRFSEDSPAAHRLLDWIRQGAVRRGERHLERLEIVNDKNFADQPGDSVSMQVLAHFSDGSSTDVTRDTSFIPDDPASVQIDSDGRAVLRRHGRHIVVARFLDQVRPVELLLPWEQSVSIASSTHIVDEAVDERLRVLGIPASPQSSDAAFVRRVTLDLTGRLPVPEDVGSFVDDTRPNKREMLIDELLGSQGFVDFWTLRLIKQLRVPEIRDQQTAMLFREWIRDCLNESVSWDVVASELVTASGAVSETGPAGFYFVGSDPRSQTEYMSEALLGIRIRCANCHDHPLDQWTQDDYHGLSAIFAGVQKGSTIGFNARGSVIHPGTGQPAVPRLPGERFLSPGTDLRTDLADWMTADNENRLARAFVNRVWAALMGRGLVEPVDDLRVTNPPTHPKLMARLATQFVNDEYDLRQLIRSICTSAAYQRSSIGMPSNETDTQFYSRALRRPLLPEVLLDAICHVTDVRESDQNGAAINSYVALDDPRAESQSLTVLGRCEVDAPCTTPEMLSGLTGILELINGHLLNDKLRDPAGRVHREVRADRTSDELIDEFYVLAFSRKPTENELVRWRSVLDDARDDDERTAVVEDFVWSLLTSTEFGTNW